VKNPEHKLLKTLLDSAAAVGAERGYFEMSQWDDLQRSCACVE
jgi:hypothetical protein